MPTCVSIVRKYGHLQKFPLQSAEVFLVVSSPPRIAYHESPPNFEKRQTNWYRKIPVISPPAYKPPPPPPPGYRPI